jgi:hypothetical protein
MPSRGVNLMRDVGFLDWTLDLTLNVYNSNYNLQWSSRQIHNCSLYSAIAIIQSLSAVHYTHTEPS